MSHTWKWICGPVPLDAKCVGCDKRLYGEHLIEWAAGKQWHLACLLDYIASQDFFVRSTPQEVSP